MNLDKKKKQKKHSPVYIICSWNIQKKHGPKHGMLKQTQSWKKLKNK